MSVMIRFSTCGEFRAVHGNEQDMTTTVIKKHKDELANFAKKIYWKVCTNFALSGCIDLCARVRFFFKLCKLGKRAFSFIS